MRFNDHSRLVGSHAFLSPSKSSWVNYEDEKLDRMVYTAMSAARGTELHDLAQKLIRLGEKLPDAMRTLNMYVNDAIGYRLTPEQMLYYSPNCYGQADAIGYRKNFLRIFDLKNGVIECSMRQLRVYAALFFLEYNIKPTAVQTELRIYQNNEVRVEEGDPIEISSIMDKIVYADRRIEEVRREVYG